MGFKQFFGVAKTIVVSLICAACVAVVGVDISLLVNKDFMTQSPAIAIVSMGAALLIVLFALLLLLNSFYKFKEDKFIACLGFFVDKIDYKDIVGVKRNEQTGDIYLIIKDGNRPSAMAFRMNLSKAKQEDFLKALESKCEGLKIETFEPIKKKKK